MTGSDRPRARVWLDAPLTAPGQTLPLPDDQAHHLTRVLRLTPGTPLALFNGRDGEWLAHLHEGPARRAAVALAHRLREYQPVPDVQLAFAPLKKQALDTLVEKAAELGVASLQPVLTEFTQVSRVNTARLAATLRDAAQQTERLDLPALAEPLALTRWLAAAPAGRPLLVAAEVGPASPLLAVLQTLAAPPLTVLIGPEGGFSTAELARLQAHPAVRPVSLGPRILRAETAALATLSVVQAVLGDWAAERPMPTFRHDMP